ncbi:MAG: response regulator transcription factor [Vallitaleaceae bacterium]|nr:response regulator transcription factor [Vallitaleaceae bacterium]
MMAKILVVEDEHKIARFLQLELIHEGSEVLVADNGYDGVKKESEESIDLVLLDLMLPGLSGIEVCRRIRSHSDVPIIMLTAKDDISDKVTGLDMGADDYITKPFAIEEVFARIRVALKRNVKKGKKSNLFRFKDLLVNVDNYEVSYAKEKVVMTKKEFSLLVYLLENVNVVVPRETILSKVWGYEYIGETNIVDVYVSYIRTKIDQKYGVEIIRTIRGVGYIIMGDQNEET